ncbi:MAG TPA: MerR family transcriptional regulator [Acidimicrobiales bacterium]|nr:MerR family transcriptional regulator [Acidimicrobiales bacterium]
MVDRAYLSIGEVLSLLTAEFPDVTISKIRFLESQGLIDPERTPSGYRKFYEGDVERLRWILRQQRENFLPLKVIRGRLGNGDTEEAGDEAPASETAATREPAPPAQGALLHAADPEPVPTPIQPTSSPKTRRSPVAPAGSPPASVPAVTEDAPERTFASGADEVALTVEELVAATGLTEARVAELQRYGLIAARSVGGTEYFDAEALQIAGAAAGFLRFGVEARHLRPFRSAAEREAGLFEQIVMPMLKQRNPAARRQATDTLNELAELGQSLRGALLRQAVRDITG